MEIGRWLLLNDVYSFRDYMLNYLDTSTVNPTVLQKVLNDMIDIIKTPKKTRTEELEAESKILRLLYDFFAVPQGLLKINPVIVPDDPLEKYTEYFAITLPDNSTLNALDQVITRVSERVVFELGWNKKTFRKEKQPEKVLAEKLLSIQKGETYLYKGKLAELCMNLENGAEKIGRLKERIFYHIQNLRKLEAELEVANELLPKKLQTALNYEVSVENPLVLESIRDYMMAALPKLKVEISHLKRKVENLNNGINFIKTDYQELSNNLKKETENLMSLINSKPISLWPKTEKTDWRKYKGRHT